MRNSADIKTDSDSINALSSSERDRGKSLYLRFSTLNGISVACLMDNVLILFAIRNGLSDPLVAVMASFNLLTMPFMVAGKRMASRIGVARTWSWGWFLRYIAAFFLIAAPFFRTTGGPGMVTGMIMFGTFSFAAFRSIGAVASKPLAGELTTVNDRGRFFSGNMMRINASQVVTLLLIIFGLRYADQMWVYQTILAVGCLTGIYTSTVIARIPESAAPRLSARQKLLRTLRNVLTERKKRNLLLIWCGGFSFFTLVLPVMMIAVKNGYGISDYAALFFALIIVLGATLAAFGSGFVADRVGPKTLFFTYTAGLILSAAYWAFAPARFSVLAVALSFLLAGGCKTGLMIALSHYFLDTVENSERVGTSLLVQVLSGAAAGLAGSVLSGGLLSFITAFIPDSLNVYRVYFKIIGGFILLLALIMSKVIIDPRTPESHSAAKSVSG